MVSSLSSRLLAGRGDCASLGSSKDNGSPRNKRTAAGSSKTRRPNDKNESTTSGYSADREGQSAFRPVVSINLHSKLKSSTRVEALNCPKRRKKNEMQFAATTVKADLARAGKEFKPLSKDLEWPTILGIESIKFKDHVELFNSKDIPDSLYPQSNIAKQTTISDYASLISTVSSFYPCKPTRMSDLKPFERFLPTGANVWSEPSTSSSVSDTLSDSGSDNTNSQTSALSPLLEDSLDTGRKKIKNRQNIRMTAINPSDDVSSFSNAITMTKILQLSKTARVVTSSFAPYNVVHANAAFHRLSGKEGTDRVIGKSFFSLLDAKENPSEENLSLSTFVMSSDQGNDPKLCLNAASKGKIEPVKCTIRVYPVLDRKVDIQDTAKVGHFAIEFVPDGKDFDETSLTRTTKSSFSQNKTPMGVVA